VHQSEFVSGGSHGDTAGPSASDDVDGPLGRVSPGPGSSPSESPAPNSTSTSAPSIRYFGYASGGPNPVMREIAPYTNIVFVWNWINQPNGVLFAAEEAKLPMVLCVNGKEMTERADRLKAVLQRHSEPVLAVCWLFPYANGFKHTDVINVGTRIKQEHPNVQFWVGQPDRMPAPPENDLIPTVVDGIVIIGLGDLTPERVKTKADEFRPGWLEKAWGRPIIWYWFASARGNKAGVVPRVEQGTFRAYLEVARRYKLAGLIFDCYGQPPGQDRVPLETRPELVEEIRQISHELGFDSRK
jgi:hypothetical protein